MKRPNYICTFLALILLGHLVAGAQANSHDILDTPVSRLEVRSDDLRAVLERLATEFKVPIGFEFSDTEYRKPVMIEFQLERASLRQALDQIQQQRSDYYWEVNDGVVNFIPRQNRNTLVKHLLETDIRHYAPESGLTQPQLSSYLARLPEVKALFPNENPFNFGIYDSRLPRRPLPDKALSKIDDATFRSILNHLVKNSGSNFWYVRGLSENLVALEF